MKRHTIKILVLILAVVLVGELLLAGILFATEDNNASLHQQSTPATTEAEPQDSTPATEPVTEATEPPTTQAPTEATEPAPTEPQEQRYVLTFAGDCTLGSMPSWFGYGSSFIRTIGTNYDFPFANVKKYFENDDFTIVNLEGVFADSGSAQTKRFTFRGPTAYTNILTGSSVEAVTLANNHSYDFGSTGYKSTKDVLEQAGVAYVEENKTQLYTTKSGLVIGLYADSFTFSHSAIRENVKKLKDAGAEVIICAFHWGIEGSYRANASQRAFAQTALDAGAHIVYGHHPHVLQKIVQNENSVVFYSLGNFSFGGHSNPRDKDSAVLQQEIIRDADGKIRLGELTMIPVCISSVPNRNNYQPTPYEEGTAAYERTMQKLLGTFTGPDLVVNYGGNEETDATDPSDATNPGTTPDPTDPSQGITPSEPSQGGTTEPSQGGTTTDPSQGSTPSAPSQGATPSEPSQGGSTQQPTQGATPTTPATPTQPATPAEPVQPVTPAAPSTGTESGGNTGGATE